MNYNRLVTHLQYFAQRMSSGDIYASEDNELYKQVRSIHPQAFLCVEKIKVFLKKQFNRMLTQDEETYLMLHIHRVTQRNERED